MLDFKKKRKEKKRKKERKKEEKKKRKKYDIQKLVDIHLYRQKSKLNV